MKKLMIVLGAIAMAASAQAAKFNWQCYAESSPWPHKYNTVYMVEGKDYTAAIAALDAGGTTVAATMYSYDLLHNLATPSATAIQLSNKAAKTGPSTLNGTYEAADTFYFILVNTTKSATAIANGDAYAVSAAYTYQDFLDNKNIVTGSDTAENLILSDGKGTTIFTAKTGTIGSSIPEPTSGLLLLLGVAGLALRRRRA